MGYVNKTLSSHILFSIYMLKTVSLFVIVHFVYIAAGKFVSRCAKIQQAFDIKCNLHIICKIQICFIGARNSVNLTSYLMLINKFFYSYEKIIDITFT